MNKLNTPEFGIKIAAATLIAAAGAYFINKLEDTPVGNLLNPRDDRDYITNLRTEQEDQEDLPDADFDEDNPLDKEDEYLTPENDVRDSTVDEADTALDRPEDTALDRPEDTALDRPEDTALDRPERDTFNSMTNESAPSTVPTVATETLPLPILEPTPSPQPLSQLANPMRGGKRSTVCKHCHSKLHTRRKYR
jgi:hypothetical protein